ncbi:hypothetical protein [uncultured Arcticibacterium sp.]|uniref:HU domain-containing protein n=1 Tax=uncultured Arcticibacterium sp. TaxID=2173042 RepID=UPI0030FB35F6
MINFDKHLKELMYEEDFFIIPSLGAFIASFTQAEITDEGQLIAPKKSFDFNGLLHVDDTDKFINYIKEKENISKGEVIDQLKNYLTRFKNGLNDNGKMILADVCAIRVSDQGYLEGKFNPELSFYTKPSFSEPVVPISVSQKIKEEINQFPQVQGEELTEEEENAEYTGDLEEEESNNKWLKYLLYLIPLLLIFGALYYVILYKPFETKTTIVAEENLEMEQSVAAKPDSVYIDANGEIDENVNPQDVVEEIKQGLVDQEGNARLKRFEVSAGLFDLKENAEKLVKRMGDAGFDAEIKLVNGMRRVYVPVNGIEAAEAMSNRIEQFTGDKSVYFDENGISNR